MLIVAELSMSMLLPINVTGPPPLAITSESEPITIAVPDAPAPSTPVTCTLAPLLIAAIDPPSSKTP